MSYFREVSVGRGGFEPPKAAPTDLQSAPFDRSGISPGFKKVNEQFFKKRSFATSHNSIFIKNNLNNPFFNNDTFTIEPMDGLEPPTC
jgi:hypothetical protein